MVLLCRSSSPEPVLSKLPGVTSVPPETTDEPVCTFSVPEVSVSDPLDWMASGALFEKFRAFTVFSKPLVTVGPVTLYSATTGVLGPPKFWMSDPPETAPVTL